MTDAPERIWAVFEPWHNTEHCRVFASASETNGQEYLRADRALALVAAEREACAKLAVAAGVRVYNANKDESPSHAAEAFDFGEGIADEIRSLTPSDALAALEADRKRVRAEALREAASHFIEQDISDVILALIEGDQTDG